VALFELCRFEEARKAFERVLEIEPSTPTPSSTWAHPRAAGRGARPARASPRPRAAIPSPSRHPRRRRRDFAARVRRVTAELPADVRHDLAGITVDTAELPSATI
jgi:hypothetical protein